MRCYIRYIVSSAPHTLDRQYLERYCSPNDELACIFALFVSTARDHTAQPPICILSTLSLLNLFFTIRSLCISTRLFPHLLWNTIWMPITLLIRVPSVRTLRRTRWEPRPEILLLHYDKLMRYVLLLSFLICIARAN